MKKIIVTPLIGLLLSLPFSTIAGTELDNVNAEVEAKAEKIDRDHGVLLTGQERNNLKIKLVAGKVADKLAIDENATLNGTVEEATETYEITDPADQRQLLIDVSAERNGDGIEPPQ